MRQAPGLIEPGLDFVAHQSFTDKGRLDVLMVDSGHSLVIAELKVVEADTMLSQGIDYYDYVIRNLDGYARAYSEHKIDPNRGPTTFPHSSKLLNHTPQPSEVDRHTRHPVHLSVHRVL